VSNLLLQFEHTSNQEKTKERERVWQLEIFIYILSVAAPE
jgi:hypothetical protein